MALPNVMLAPGGKEVVAIDARDLIPGDLTMGGATVVGVMTSPDGRQVQVDFIGSPTQVFPGNARLIIHNDRF